MTDRDYKGGSLMKKKSVWTRYSAQDKVLLSAGYLLLGLFAVAIIVPMLYIVVASFIDPITLQNKGITFDFSKWTTKIGRAHV